MSGEFTSPQSMRNSGVQQAAFTVDTRAPALARLSMNQMTTYRWSLVEDVVGYCRAGINAIGLWRPKLVEFGEERGIEVITESELAVSSVSWAGGFTGANGHSYAEAVADTRDALRLSAAVDADCLVIVSGARAGHTNRHARRLLVDALRELADEAALHDVRLALQPMHPMFEHEWTFLTTLDQTLDVVDGCRHPFVGLAFDAYQLWQEPRLMARIPEIAPLTATVQLSDWREPPRSESDRCLPGTGVIPLGDIVREFTRSKYDGFFELGIWSEELWRSDYTHLIERCRESFEALYRP